MTRTNWTAVCFLVVATASASTAQAQTSGQTHRFFDRLNNSLTAIESVALLADGITTQRAFNRFPGRVREVDPIARVFVNHGWPGMIAGGTLFVSADVGLRYWLHRTGHHRVERWVPSILIAYGGISATHNARLLSRLGDDWTGVRSAALRAATPSSNSGFFRRDTQRARRIY